MPDFEKYTKAECDYGPGKWPEECGTCVHYIPKGLCKIVVGRIYERDLCKFHVYSKGKEHLEEWGPGEWHPDKWEPGEWDPKDRPSKPWTPMFPKDWQ